MMINDHYQRRREHQQAALTQAEQQRLIDSGDGRIQKVQPAYQVIWAALARRLAGIQPESYTSAKNNKTFQQPESNSAAHVPLGGE